MSESSSQIELPPPDPKFIKYLLNPDHEYECYFIVGNEEFEIPVEKIGVVKKMLLAHSDVLRIELEDSQMAEKNNVKVNDLYPDTFRNLLRFVYGFDPTVTMTFNDADNLLYAAEKYMISDLKNKVASRLMTLLSYENICGLMNNPACYKMLELNSEITKILQQQTNLVLNSPQFLDLSSSAFLTILQQEKLLVPEIELWHSTVKWAKNRANAEEGAVLRKELTSHMKHLRVCTLTCEEICKEVVPTGILTHDELKLVCLSHETNEKQLQLTEICNEVEPRPRSFIFSEMLVINLGFNCQYGNIISSRFMINTKECDIELVSFKFYPSTSSQYEIIGAIHIKGPQNVEGNHTVTTLNVDFQKIVSQNTKFDVPLTVNGENVSLLANSSYSVDINASPFAYAYYNSNSPSNISCNHFTVGFVCQVNYYCSHVQEISYKTKTLI